jgi:hypothetical protein
MAADERRGCALLDELLEKSDKSPVSQLLVRGGKILHSLDAQLTPRLQLETVRHGQLVVAVTRLSDVFLRSS